MTGWNGFFQIAIKVLFGFGAGAVTASGLFALISSIQLVNRFAAVTGTTHHLCLYENMVISGAVIGNVLFIFHVSFQLPHWMSLFCAIFYGFGAGIFIGTFAVCLAETVKALPIFIRRVRIGAGLGWIILSIALGKCVGHLIYYLVLYQT